MTTAVDQLNTRHLDIAHALARLPLVIRTLAAGAAATPEDRAAITDLAVSLVGSVEGESSVSFDDTNATVVYASATTSIGVKVDARDYYKGSHPGTGLYYRSFALTF